MWLIYNNISTIYFDLNSLFFILAFAPALNFEIIVCNGSYSVKYLLWIDTLEWCVLTRYILDQVQNFEGKWHCMFGHGLFLPYLTSLLACHVLELGINGIMWVNKTCVTFRQSAACRHVIQELIFAIPALMCNLTYQPKFVLLIAFVTDRLVRCCF